MSRFSYNQEEFKASAPLTIPLFGDQQRGLGCYQVFLCTNLPYEIRVRRRADDRLVIKKLSGTDTGPDAHPVAKAILEKIEEGGDELQGGFDCSVVDTGIQNSDLDYAAAEAVSWTAALLAMAGSSILESSLGISRTAFSAIGGSPEKEGLWAATELGGLVAVKGFEEQAIRAFEIPLDGFMLTKTSAMPEKSMEVSSKEAHQATAELVSGMGSTFASAPTDTLLGKLSEISEANAMIGYAHTTLRDMCADSMDLFSSNDIEPYEFARLLDEQENMRNEYLGLTTQKMNTMALRAKKSGALACSGFDNDGSVVIYAPRGRKSVSQAIESEGCIGVAVDRGKGVCIEDIGWDDT
ncbi:MAG: hypothetical protein QF437_11730 [Planctomycetota bacterium]|jgi:hypothetical protein|nr:hypothetical protein [Planctomycetota bacterium]MDP7131155.1 hypothetical protein [Planctomycetota bacterium]